MLSWSVSLCKRWCVFSSRVPWVVFIVKWFHSFAVASFILHTIWLFCSPRVSPRGLLLFGVVVIVAVVEDSNLWCGVFIFIYSSVYKAKLTQIQLAQQSLSSLRVYVNCVKVTLSRMVFKSWQTISNSYYYFDCKTFEECLAGINTTTTVSTV